MDIIFKGRHTEVQEKFRQRALAKLVKLEKLDHKAVRVDVEVSEEHNPRQSDRRERVELTVWTRGQTIRAEAAADDRATALDRAVAKLEENLRRLCDRRKAARHGVAAVSRVPDPRTVSAEGAAAADTAGYRPRGRQLASGTS